MEHITVLKKELVSNLNIKSDGIYIDCTGGGGGHSLEIVKELSPQGKLIIFDRDQVALSKLNLLFSEEIKKNRVILINSPFSKIKTEVASLNLLEKIDGICADIGVSSFQLSESERGFSFMKDGPLDMRMDQSNGIPASEVVNTFSFEEMARIFSDYGEESFAGKIAHRIVERRSTSLFQNTLDLANLVENTIPKKFQKKIHAATKVFQALRIYVNDELEELKNLLAEGYELLKDGGRFGIISFHSLEDRIVKNYFKELSGKNSANRELNKLPVSEEVLNKMKNIRANVLKPFPIIPTAEEISANPKSRSAKLRILEKIKPKE